MHPKIEQLQDATARLRHGAPVDETRLLRRDGVIVGAEKRTVPFDPGRIMASGTKLTGELNQLKLDGDDAVLYLAAFSDYADAAAEHASVRDGARLQRMAQAARSQLEEAGVTL